MLRKAKLNDSKQIHSLIVFWAKEGRVLERSLNYVYENIRNFWVYTESEKVIGCCALSIVGWQDLGEIKSLGVAKGYEGKGVGAKLVKKCLDDARSLGVKKVFALTFVKDFFKKLGFKDVDKKNLPHKIWSECINCISFPDCCEEAVILTLSLKGGLKCL